jgi:DNA (cytosine-5)-methyltransferase 1
VLAHHYPEVPNLGDMTTIARRVLTGEVEAPDVFCGGTPCQAFSVAGLRQSLDDARGNLTLKFVEIADAIDHVRAGRGEDECIVFWENVPGVLNTKDNAFGCFLGGLAGEDGPLEPPGGKWANAGAVYGPRRAVAWRTLDAQYFGVAQRRRRVFVVASARKGFDPATVLFEWNGVRRDTAPRRETGQSAAAVLEIGPGGGRFTDLNPTLDTRAKDGPIRNQLAGAVLQPVAPTLDGSFGRLQGCSGQDASHGHGHLVPIAFDTTKITSKANFSNPQPGNPCHPLATGAHAPAIAFPANLSGTQCASAENLSPALGALNPTAVAVQDVRAMNKSQNGRGWNEDGSAYTVDTQATQGVAVAMRVRRLTPAECERLQGFPDGYTDIPWTEYQRIQRRAEKVGTSFEAELQKHGKVLRGPKTPECPDGPRYKALGNSWAVPNVRWIGRRIHAEIGA